MRLKASPALKGLNIQIRKDPQMFRPKLKTFE